MKTEKMNVSRLAINPHNPRVISGDKYEKLVKSILVFPAMLELRPIVVDEKLQALGGNMRTRALQDIAAMTLKRIEELLQQCNDYTQQAPEWQDLLLQHWEKFLKEPVVSVIMEKSLTESEKRQFIIKDNVGYGTWDYDILANEWDNAQLQDWGMDVWQDDGTTWDNLGDVEGDAKPPALEKPIKLEVLIPKDLEDNVEDIKRAVEITLEEFEGCEVK